MKLIELKDKELQRLIKQVTTLAKKHYAKANVVHDVVGKDKHMLTIEAPPSILEDVVALIEKSPRAKVLSFSRFPGHYDWNSETYIKDADVVTFKL